MLPICLWTGIKWEKEKRWMKLSTYPESIDWKSFYKTLKVSRPLRNLMLNMSRNHSYLPSVPCLFSLQTWLSISFHDFGLTLSRKKFHFHMNEAWTKAAIANFSLTFCFAKKRRKLKMKFCVQTTTRKWNEDAMLWIECMIFK